MPASSSDNGSDGGDGDVDTSEVDTDELSSEEGGENDKAVRNSLLMRSNSRRAIINLNHKTDQDFSQNISNYTCTCLSVYHA